MKILLKKPLALNETGGRSNNEDSVFPPKGTALPDQRLFMVCDGVGGSEKGEIASALAIDSIRDYFLKNLFSGSYQSYLASAIAYTQQQFDDHIETHPEAKGMGTTLTLLFFSSIGALVAHIGDSRVYQIRAGKILFQTEDHSLVNALVKNNIITPEEALSHPQRNVITRAIQGNTVSKTNADISLITDIRSGDYFFLCTDGILEKISNDILCSILSKTITNDEKIAEIHELCSGQTRDNFSAYLVQVDKISVPYNFSRLVKPVNNLLKTKKGLNTSFKFTWTRKTIIISLLSLIAILVILYFLLPAKTQHVDTNGHVKPTNSQHKNSDVRKPVKQLQEQPKPESAVIAAKPKKNSVKEKDNADKKGPESSNKPNEDSISTQKSQPVSPDNKPQTEQPDKSNPKK